MQLEIRRIKLEVMKMEKKLVALVFIALLVGLGGGYGLGYVIYQPQIQNLQNELTTLSSEVVNLNSEVEELKTPQPKPNFEIWIFEQDIDYTKFGVRNIGNTDAHDVVFTAETTLLAGILAGTVRPIIEKGEAYWFNVPLPIDRIISVWVTCREGALTVLYLK